MSSMRTSTEGSREAEAQLVERAAVGDQEACATLVRLHADRLLVVARRFLHSEQDCADAVQEAFISAFGALRTFTGESRLGTWLHRITVNACLMRLRSKGRRPERSIEELLPSFDGSGHQIAPPRPWRDDAFQAVASQETREQVRACIDQLPEPFRVVLLLRDIEELDTETTARLLRCTVSSVKTRLHRARQALRTLLEPVFGSAA